MTRFWKYVQSNINNRWYNVSLSVKNDALFLEWSNSAVKGDNEKLK